MKHFVAVLFLGMAMAASGQKLDPVIRVTPEVEGKGYLEQRRVLVGPGVRQPAAYAGYLGFVGWVAVAQTKKGTLLVTFSSGYWHASPPTPFAFLKASDIASWRKMGMPEVEAPRGGRAEIMRSEDGGKAWSAPKVMIDTEWDDRAPAIAQMADGTLVGSFFTYPKAGVAIIRSFDDGKTWEQTPRMIRAPFATLATDGPPLVMPGGKLLLATYGTETEGGKYEAIGIFESGDRGESWKHLSTVRAAQEMTEPGLERMKDGRLVLITRSEGAVSYSKDEGKTWTEPRNLPVRMFDPWLLRLKSGQLLCLHGSYQRPQRGLRALISNDGGESWNGAGTNYGYAVDPTAYGYSRGVEQKDGTVYVVYQGTGGHKSEDARSMTLYGIRVKVKKDGRGVETLAAPGR